MFSKVIQGAVATVFIGLWLGTNSTHALAQTPLESLPPEIEPPSEEGLPRPDIFQEIPPPDDLLQTLPVPPLPTPGENIPQAVRVSRFIFEGSTVFSDAQLAAVTEPFLNRQLSFTELFEVRSAVTQLYADAGYINSVAIIPPQSFEEGGTVTITIQEGQLEQLQVISPGRLRPSYVERRLEQAIQPPFNINQLLETLQLLQLDPLIDRVSAELAAGTELGQSLLTVNVEESDSSTLALSLMNSRSPSVGTAQARAEYTEANLLGNGEQLSIGLSKTAGLTSVDASYRFFLNPRNGTLQFSSGFTDSNVVEAPFDILEIESDASFFEVTWRQPLTLTPTEEFALGLTASIQGSRSIFLRDFFGEVVGFPTLGADDTGRSRVTALRFFQDWVKQQPKQVLAVRSQFSLGLDILGATAGDREPDTRFFDWRGQAQWVRLLAPETLLVLQGDLQLTTGPLLPLEQFGLGGNHSVRGYRQDLLLVDNGISASAEVRVPIFRNPNRTDLLQVIPFIDAGAGWNATRANPSPNVLLSTGVGFLWQSDNSLSARLDWGIPLIADRRAGSSWQESGVYFELRYSGL